MESLQQTAIQIKKIYTELNQSLKDSVYKSLEIGRLLFEVRKQLTPEEYPNWISENCNFSSRWALQYEKLYKYKNQLQIGEHLSDLSTAYKKVSEIEYQEKQTEEQRKRSMIAEYRKTGKKPEGWDRSLDYIIQRDTDAQKRYMEEKKKIEDERHERSQQRVREEHANDMFSDALGRAADEILNKHKERAAWKEKIRVSDNGKDNAFMDAIIDYLDTLPNDNRRIEACNNIIKICRNISVDLQKVTS